MIVNCFKPASIKNVAWPCSFNITYMRKHFLYFYQSKIERKTKKQCFCELIADLIFPASEAYQVRTQYQTHL